MRIEEFQNNLNPVIPRGLFCLIRQTYDRFVVLPFAHKHPTSSVEPQDYELEFQVEGCESGSEDSDACGRMRRLHEANGRIFMRL